jgi:hypothetical protein
MKTRSFGSLPRAGTLVVGLAMSGCASMFPSFEGPLAVGSWTAQIPIGAVATQVQCELREFLRDSRNADILDPTQMASVTLSLQTDNTGSVQYTGINLSKVGLTSLAQLITVQNNAPSLQAKIQGKSTVSAQVALSVPQTLKPTTIPGTWSPDPKNPGKFKKSPDVVIKGLDSVGDCPAFPGGFLNRLYLKAWFDRFFENLRDNHQNTEGVCMPSITLKTQFALVLDVSAGVNPLPGTAFIVPISGLTGDYSPTFTHSLQIAFALKKFGSNNLCTKIPTTQPNRVIGL